MFDRPRRRSRLGSALTIAELVYHNTVRSVRKTHSNAVIAIGMNIAQTAILVGAFYLLFAVLGVRSVPIRGDFLLYLMTGIFLYLVHIRTVTAILGSEGPASPMMMHAPMTTAVAIGAAALGQLYIQLLSMGTVLWVYHVVWGPITIHDPVGAFAMVILAWLYGVAVGLCLLALKPWAPDVVTIATTIYTRVSLFASGKMFVANALPATLLAFFDWNPLFHAIDQARGFTFINYFPHNSSLAYPVLVSLGVLMVGLMGEFQTRRHASISWNARR